MLKTIAKKYRKTIAVLAIPSAAYVSSVLMYNMSQGNNAIQKTICGHNHILMLRKNGELWSYVFEGHVKSNDNDNLIFNIETEKNKPSSLELCETKNVKQIFKVGRDTYLLKDDGRLYLLDGLGHNNSKVRLVAKNNEIIDVKNSPGINAIIALNRKTSKTYIVNEDEILKNNPNYESNGLKAVLLDNGCEIIGFDKRYGAIVALDKATQQKYLVNERELLEKYSDESSSSLNNKIFGLFRDFDNQNIKVIEVGSNIFELDTKAKILYKNKNQILDNVDDMTQLYNKYTEYGDEIAWSYNQAQLTILISNKLLFYNNDSDQFNHVETFGTPIQYCQKKIKSLL